MRRKGLIILALGALTQAAVAQAQMPPDAAALRTREAGVPQQVWYPTNYYDLRIAGEAHASENPRPLRRMVTRCAEGGGRCYNVFDCSAEPVPFDPADPAVSRYGRTALEVSRLNSELTRIGYPGKVYAQPLSDFERQLIAGDTFLSDAQIGARADASLPEAMKKPQDGDAGTDAGDGPFLGLADAIEANRRVLAPAMPRAVAKDGCPRRPGGPITVRTVPAGAEILLISAFAFKVCTRRVPDPWDHFACKWNEWEAGVERTKPYGRFVYQVTWPDGVVRKGTRQIEPKSGENAVTVTFRKRGS